jgi:hypothetical protein
MVTEAIQVTGEVVKALTLAVCGWLGSLASLGLGERASGTEIPAFEVVGLGAGGSFL